VGAHGFQVGKFRRGEFAGGVLGGGAGGVGVAHGLGEGAAVEIFGASAQMPGAKHPAIAGGEVQELRVVGMMVALRYGPGARWSWR